MKDAFLVIFGWVTDLLKRPTASFFDEDSDEYAIIEQLKAGWGKTDTAVLLRELTADYGEKATQTVEKFLEMNNQRDWAAIGSQAAHKGSEIEDFIRILWGPLKDQGFEYTSSQENGKTTFCVTKCPVYELAEKTGLHDWLYVLACSGDYIMPGAFCPKIGFDRTKTLMQGHEICNHQYYYRQDVDQQ